VVQRSAGSTSELKIGYSAAYFGLLMSCSCKGAPEHLLAKKSELWEVPCRSFMKRVVLFDFSLNHCLVIELCHFLTFHFIISPSHPSSVALPRLISYMGLGPYVGVRMMFASRYRVPCTYGHSFLAPKMVDLSNWKMHY